MWSSLLDMTMNKRASHVQVCHNGLNHRRSGQFTLAPRVQGFSGARNAAAIWIIGVTSWACVGP
mgnify:CR=1 FL=1